MNTNLSSLSSLEAVLIGLVVAGFFVVRQFSVRRVESAWMVLVPLGLAYFGATALGNLGTAGLVSLAINTSVGVVLGFRRGATFRIWVGEHGEALMQGTRVTLLFWMVTIAAKVALSIVGQQVGMSSLASGGTELLIPLAATLAAQNIVVYLRSRDQQLVAA